MYSSDVLALCIVKKRKEAMNSIIYGNVNRQMIYKMYGLWNFDRFDISGLSIGHLRNHVHATERE